MDPAIELTEARETDLGIIKEIYDYYILHSTASFFTEKVTTEELKSFILIGHPVYRSFMIHSDGEVCGFCYFSPFNKRQAYRHTAEVTLYLKQGFTGKGIGKEVLRRMEEMSAGLGIFVLIAVIAAENKPSIALFEQCGFERCAHYRKVGVKFNRIQDVYAYEKILSTF
ncbi:MAG TPA: GNAT family N-acetyltransferase [Bacteroidales bacterium]|nr:GNAT family N-acetyltransferase [Bacteroidales bacterium]